MMPGKMAPPWQTAEMMAPAAYMLAAIAWRPVGQVLDGWTGGSGERGREGRKGRKGEIERDK